MVKKPILASYSLICAITIGLVLTSCESGNTGAAIQFAERVKIEVMTDNGVSKLPAGDNDRMKIKLDEKLNTDIQLTLMHGDSSRLNRRMATGDYPDLFMLGRIQMQEYARKGLLLDLTPYMGKLEQARKFIGEDSLKKGSVDGRIYALAKKRSIPFYNLWIRKDWLERLNLQIPTTIEELFHVAKAFTENDPDGNGKPDTYGITGYKMSTFSPVFTAFGVGGIDSFYMKDGKLMNALYDPAMKDALKFINGMIDEGVVDPDLLLHTGDRHAKKAFQGKVGIIWYSFPEMTKPANVTEYKTINPNAVWVQVPALKGPGGQFAGTWDVGASPMHAIPKTMEKNPVKLQRLFDLLNYVASPEGSMLVAHGEEGRHWYRENGKIVRTELRLKEHAFMYQLLGREEIEYLESGYTKEVVDFSANTQRIEVYDGLLYIPEGFSPADANRYIDEEVSAFAYGKRPLSEYDDFLKRLEDGFQYKLMLHSAEKQLKELGIFK